MSTQIIKTGKMFRTIEEAIRTPVDEEKRTVELTFSSEVPVARWFGDEILDHQEKSVRLSRLRKAGPLILNHDHRNQIGVIEKVWIGADRKGHAVVRFGKSGLADEIFNDVLDGIRKNVSVGYRIHRMLLEEENNETKIYRAVDWEPLEISIVSVPADISVGVGRDTDAEFDTVVDQPRKETRIMDQDKNKDQTINQEPTTQDTTRQELSNQQTPTISIVKDNTDDKAIKAERNRVADILAIGQAFNCEKRALEAIQNGLSVDDFRTAVLETLRDKVKPVEPDTDNLGLSQKEVKQYSFLKVINALANPTDRKIQEAAKFEFEVSRAFAEKVRKEPRGVFVPPEILQRDMTVGTDTAGGYLVATELLAANFIELLRNKMVVKRAGATILSDLVGDIAIPKQTGGATAYWVAESGAPTESQQTIGQVALTPKTVGAFTDISRRLLLQSSIDIENFVRSDLATVLALAVDLAALHGSGTSNEPTGIAATTGIGNVAIGTNGGAPTWGHIIDLETEVAIDNADVGKLAYLTNAKVRGKLKQIYTNATYGEIPVWTKGSEPGVGEMNGYPAYVSNQVSSSLTKGSGTGLSAIFFGNWGDLIMAFWSGIDLLVDPYTGSTSGTVRVVAFQDVDVAVRHPESFAAILDAATD